jgi:hypothetical protein
MAAGLLVTVLFVTAAFQHQAILDAHALATFKPSQQVAKIEQELRLTTSARAMLYRAHPQINPKAVFNRNCNTVPHELELGCFYRGRIYILQIDNPSLQPEMDVVTAHELLHAAWVRLSPGERTELAVELQRVYSTMTDPELKERMATYARTEPGEEANELHSILGTEYGNLSPRLEQYYARYFTVRSAVVARHTAYEEVFSARKAELEAQLQLIRAKKSQLSVLNRRMDTLKTSNQIQAYNALVPSQNALVDEINNQIEAYQRGVDEYNALSKSLDSSEITDTEPAAQ